MSEEWRTVASASDYEVSNLGRVRSHKGKTPRILRPGRNSDGYANQSLSVDGRRVYTNAHTLVMEAFVGPRPAGMQVRHLDGDPSNNRLDNLAYGTPAENAADKRRHGTDWALNKSECPSGHPYAPGNLYLRPNGHRVCRTCAIERQRRLREKAKGHLAKAS